MKECGLNLLSQLDDVMRYKSRMISPKLCTELIPKANPSAAYTWHPASPNNHLEKNHWGKIRKNLRSVFESLAGMLSTIGGHKLNQVCILHGIAIKRLMKVKWQ